MKSFNNPSLTDLFFVDCTTVGNTGFFSFFITWFYIIVVTRLVAGSRSNTAGTPVDIWIPILYPLPKRGFSFVLIGILARSWKPLQDCYYDFGDGAGKGISRPEWIIIWIVTVVEAVVTLRVICARVSIETTFGLMCRGVSGLPLELECHCRSYGRCHYDNCDVDTSCYIKHDGLFQSGFRKFFCSWVWGPRQMDLLSWLEPQ
jgi:hypothetical protein